LFDLAPATSAVVGDDLSEHLAESAGVDLLVLTYRDHAGGFVLVTACNDAFGIRNDRPVVEENVDVVLRGQQRADVALEHEIGLHPPLNGLFDFRINSMHKITDLLADDLLPLGERVDVLVDPRILLISHCCNISEAPGYGSADSGAPPKSLSAR
jgi:hypothetical protein